VVRGAAGWAPLLLAACTSPPWDPDSLVDELRVVAVVGSPPEVAPGESLDLDVHVMDPADGPRDVLGWFCTFWSGTCAEAGVDRPLADFAVVRRDADLVERVRFTVPPELATLLPPDAAAQPLAWWTLACRPGLCPVIDAVEAAPAPGSAAWDDLVLDLAAPGAWLRDLPMEGVSLAVKTLLVSQRPASERNRNPVLEREDDEPIEVAPDEIVDLAFDVDEGAVHPLASAGAFSAPAFGAQGETRVRWYAPSLPGTVDLLVVAEDGVGGTGVWRHAATVRPP
jgi:hypothetical protein